MQQNDYEMKCRHCSAEWETQWEYCPVCERNAGGAIYPEQQTAKERADIARLVDLITAAFDGVRVENGTTIHEAGLEGLVVDNRLRIAARANDTEVDWMEVPDWKIARFSSALSFLDLQGWRFYIPAYMIWSLKNWRTTDSVTADFVIWGFEPACEELSLPRYATLSRPESCAVYEFVHFFCEYSSEPEPRRAMQRYWHQFAPKG